MTALSTSSWNFISHERDVRWKTVGDSHRFVFFFYNTSKISVLFFFINNCNSPISITVAFWVSFHNYREVTVRCNHNHEDIAHRKLVSTYSYFHRRVIFRSNFFKCLLCFSDWRRIIEAEIIAQNQKSLQETLTFYTETTTQYFMFFFSYSTGVLFLNTSRALYIHIKNQVSDTCCNCRKQSILSYWF